MPASGTAITIHYLAYNVTTGLFVTGDENNHTVRLVRDGTVITPTAGPTEPDATNCEGLYAVSLSAAEHSGVMHTLCVQSSTADVLIQPVTWTSETSAAAIADNAITAAAIAANALNGKGDWSTHDAAAVLTAFQNDQDYGLLLSNVGDILTDTGTTLPGQISALNDLSAAQVRTEADAALVAIHLDHLLAVDYDPASPPGAATALLNELVESDGGVARYTANALEQAPTGSGASVDAIADAVWDEQRSGHTTAGSFGEGVGVADKAGYSLSSSGLSQVTAWSVDITGTITGSLTGSVGSVSAAVTLPAIPSGWITAAGVAASALDGKGDWLSSAQAQAAADAALVAFGAATASGVQASVDGIAIPTADEVRDAVWAVAIDGGLDAQQATRIMLAALAGKVSGAGTTTITFRDAGDARDAIVATVDADGNRGTVTLDGGN